MLKMYLRRQDAGGEAAFWEDNWAARDLAPAVAACAGKPERPLLDQWLPRTGLTLEGGCGFGAWVAYYRGRGYRVVGLDFAPAALVTLKGLAPETPACAGSITALPLPNASVDAYLSGGVVEHDEAGPLAALNEARRVLRPGGTLLVSVPDLNPLRRVMYRRQRLALADAGLPSVGLVRASRFAVEPSPWPNMRFFQYLFGEREFRRLLREAGFTVLQTLGYGYRLTLLEVGALRGGLEWLEGRRYAAAADLFDSAGDGGDAGPGGRFEPVRQSLRRFLFAEQAYNPATVPLRAFLRATAANMRMYACVRE